jgi:hypothetical protein
MSQRRLWLRALGADTLSAKGCVLRLGRNFHDSEAESDAESDAES